MKIYGPLLVALCSLLLGAAGPEVATQTFRLGEGSEVSFKTFGKSQSHPSSGKFTAVLSKITLNPRALNKAKGAFDILLTSIATRDASWDAMFRDAPFLQIAQFPQAKYQLASVGGATSLVKDKLTKAVLLGSLTFHGVTRRLPVNVTILYTGPSNQPSAGQSSRSSSERIVVEGKFRIRWTDFDIEVPSGAPTDLSGEGAIVSIKLAYDKGPAS